MRAAFVLLAESWGACGPEEGLCRWYKRFYVGVTISQQIRLLGAKFNVHPQCRPRRCEWQASSFSGLCLPREGSLPAAGPRPGLPGPAQSTALPKAPVRKPASRRAARKPSQPGTTASLLVLFPMLPNLARASPRDSDVEGNVIPLTGLFG